MDSGPVLVRPAVLGDAARIAEVHVLSWQSGYRGLLPQALLDGLDPEQRIARWTATVEKADWPRRGTLVVERAGEVAGFADLYATCDEDADEAGEIASFYVVPDAWGRGLGTCLMASAVDALAAAGCRTATLWVLEGNVRAQRFYTGTGWRPDGAVRDDTMAGVAVRELCYRRNLPG